MTTSSTDRTTTDNPQNRRDLRAERAPSRFTDRTHVFTTNYVWEIPFFNQASPLLKSLLAGWQLSGITTLQTGLPLTITEDTLSGTRGNRPSLVGDPKENVPSTGLFHFNPTAFAPAPAGTFGNSGRGLIRGPGRNQWDLSVIRNFKFSEGNKIQFRAEFFNLFNHTQFTAVETSTAATANFGKYTGTRGLVKSNLL